LNKWLALIAFSVLLLVPVGAQNAFAMVVGMDPNNLGTMSMTPVTTLQACTEIEYVFTGIGSGSLGAQNFVDSDFIITVSADTNNVMEIFFPGVFTNRALSVQVQVVGVGIATVTTETGVFSNTNLDGVGWSNFNGDDIVNDIYDIGDIGVDVANYDLTTNIGPVSSQSQFFTSNFDAITDQGILDVSSITDATFQAIIVNCPTVGGELIPIETTTLLLAGAQSFSWMIPVILSGIGIGLFVVSRKSENS